MATQAKQAKLDTKNNHENTDEQAGEIQTHTNDPLKHRPS